MNAYVAGALMAIGVVLYIVGFRGLLATGQTTHAGGLASADGLTMAALVAAVAASLLFGAVLVGPEGGSILIVLGIPVALTAISVLTRSAAVRIVAAALLDAGCVLALLSIGAFYAPAAIMLTIAAARTPRSRLRRQINGSPGIPKGGAAAVAAGSSTVGRRRRGRQ